MCWSPGPARRGAASLRKSPIDSEIRASLALLRGRKGVRSWLSQELLDGLAHSWSRLDRARPVRSEDAHRVVEALAEWLELSIRFDDELRATMGGAYLAPLSHAADALPALRLVHELMAGGHPVNDFVTISAGSPPTYHDALGRDWPELPTISLAGGSPAGEAAYRQHLAGVAARLTAAGVTQFLLDTALDRRDDLAGAASPVG